jgi:hypothetical protein
MMAAKETLCVVTRHATRQEMLCSLENYITDFAHAKDQQSHVAIYHLDLLLSEVERTRGKAVGRAADLGRAMGEVEAMKLVCKWMQ